MSIESIEDQIAEHYVSPLPPKRICDWKPRPGYPACTTPLAQFNRESLCFRHTQLERTLKTMKDFTRNIEPEQPQEIAQPKELRLCAVMGCYRKLADYNRSGRCMVHQYIRPGMQMKDGTIPRPVPIAPLPPISPLEPIQPLEPIEEEKKEGEIVSIAEMEKQAILEAVRQSKGDKLMAAKLLGIGKTTLYRRLKEMTPVTEEKAVRTCAAKGCDVVLQGMQLKDGSVPKPHTAISLRMAETRARNAAAGGALPQGTVIAETTVIVGSVMPIMVDHAVTASTLCELKVPIERLDDFLMKLPVVDKIRIVERELFGGW